MAQQKILYIVNNIEWFWSHRLPLALGAQEAGYDVGIVVTGASQDPRLADYGFTPIELPAIGQGLGPRAVAKAIANISSIIAQHKPDIVHVITIKYAFLAGLAALFHPRVKVVHLIAGLGYLFSGADVKSRLLRFCVSPLLRVALRNKRTQIICQNPDDEAILIKDGLIAADRTTLIRGSGVDVEQFAPRQYAPQDSIPRVVMPTRLVHDKGVSVFIEAAQILQQKGVKVDMQIAGGVTAYNPLAISADEMRTMIAASNGAAQWLGKVSDMPDLLSRATLVAYPSHYREGIPKVLLEAAAMGKPIITTDHPGCREVVVDGVNGMLVPIKNAAVLAHAIEAVLGSTERLIEMGKASREKALAEFDANIIVAQTLKVYDCFSS